MVRPTDYPPVAIGHTWVGFDLDGTLSEHIWPKEGIGEPLSDGVLAARHYKRAGYRIVIYTARPWWDHQNITEWLERHGIPYDQVVCGKLAVGLMVDDRAWRPPWA